MPDFEGVEKVVLRPGANAVPITFAFVAASNNVANDGSVPFGATISNATVAVYDQDGTDRTGNCVNANSTQVVGLTVSATLKHPNTGANNTTAITIVGRKVYTALVTLTLSTGAVVPYKGQRILVDPNYA